MAALTCFSLSVIFHKTFLLQLESYHIVFFDPRKSCALFSVRGFSLAFHIQLIVKFHLP